jgi:hypothetical protein
MARMEVRLRASFDALWRNAGEASPCGKIPDCASLHPVTNAARERARERILEVLSLEAPASG